MVVGAQVSPLACISRNKVSLQRRLFKNMHQAKAAQVSAGSVGHVAPTRERINHFPQPVTQVVTR